MIQTLVTISMGIPLLHIFVNIHLRITYLRIRNVAPVMMIPLIIVNIKFLSIPTFDNGLLRMVYSYSPCFSASRYS